MSEAVGEIGQPRLLRHAVSAQPFLSQKKIAQQCLGARDHGIGGGDPAVSQTQPSLVDQLNDRLTLIGATVPVHAQEEHALHGIDALRLPL